MQKKTEKAISIINHTTHTICPECNIKRLQKTRRAKGEIITIILPPLYNYFLSFWYYFLPYTCNPHFREVCD